MTPVGGSRIFSEIMQQRVEQLVELEVSSVRGKRRLGELTVLGGVLDLDTDASARPVGNVQVVEPVT